MQVMMIYILFDVFVFFRCVQNEWRKGLWIYSIGNKTVEVSEQFVNML
jgi:hypothetical protein